MGTDEAKEALFLGGDKLAGKLPGSSSCVTGGLTPAHVDRMIEEVSDRDAF